MSNFARTLAPLAVALSIGLAPAHAEGLLGTESAPPAWAPMSEDQLQGEVARFEAQAAAGEATPEMQNRIVAHLVGLAFSQLSVAALPAMRTLNRDRPAETLTEDAKTRLRGTFGDQVDRVTVVYRAKLFDAETLRTLLGDGWLVKKLREYGVLDRITLIEKAAGMTIGDWIFVTGEPGAEGQVRLMAHELVHVRQYVQAGSLADAAYNYGYAYVMCGWDYRTHPLENEAREVAKAFES